MRRNDVFVGQLDLKGRIRQHLDYGAFKLNNVILWQKNLSFPKCSSAVAIFRFTAEGRENAADVAVIAHPIGDLLNTFHTGKRDQLQMLELLFLGIDTFPQPSVRDCNMLVVEFGNDHKQAVGISARDRLRDASDHGSGDLVLHLSGFVGYFIGRRSGTKTVFAYI